MQRYYALRIERSTRSDLQIANASFRYIPVACRIYVKRAASNRTGPRGVIC